MSGTTKLSGWLGLASAVLTVAGSIVGGTLWLSHKFTELGDRVVEVRNTEDARIAKLESAIKVLVSQQPNQMRQLVHDLLAEQKQLMPRGAPQPYSVEVMRGDKRIVAHRHGDAVATAADSDVSADAPAAVPATPAAPSPKEKAK